MHTEWSKRLDSELGLAAFTEPQFDFSNLVDVRIKVNAMTAALKSGGYWHSLEEGLIIRDQIIPGPKGEQNIMVRIYRNARIAFPAPAVLFIHGGGYMIGDLEFEHSRCLKWAQETDCIVVAVDYRLAPENAFPSAVEDCYQSLLWITKNASRLGMDVHRIIIAGSSCGGGLAAAVALKSRDIGHPSIAFQLLIYPVLDDRMTTKSMKEFVDTPGWNRESSIHMWRNYLGESCKTVSPYAAPARAINLAGLPPAYVLTAELDPLRDEGIEYARRLLHFGVSTELHQYAGAYHGFDALSWPSISKSALYSQIEAINRAVSNQRRRAG